MGLYGGIGGSRTEQCSQQSFKCLLSQQSVNRTEQHYQHSTAQHSTSQQHNHSLPPLSLPRLGVSKPQQSADTTAAAAVCCCPLLAGAMSSFYNPLQRFYKFVLKRLLGQFLSSELDLEQLDVALSSGDVRLHRLSLNTAQLNEWADGLPVRVQSARIASLHCQVPWRSLLSQHCTLHIRGLHIAVAPIAAAAHSHGGGQSLHDSVYGAINDGLQRLNSRQLRQQVRLHRQLASAIHASQHFQQQHTRQPASVDAAEEERALAEAEAETDRVERTRRRRRRRLQRLANKRAAQGRLRTQEGGNVDPDTDTDADTNDDRTDDEDDEDDQQSQQSHSQRRPAGGEEARDEEADEDIAAAGLRVVASFIERVVSMTEVTMDDITVAIDCPVDSSDEQFQHSPSPPASVQLELHIPSLEYCDLSRAASLSSSSVSSASGTAGTPASLPPLSAGPVFSYSKLIRLHGFHLSLRTADGERLTIAHADVGQQCDVRVKVRMLDGGTVADTEVDVSSMRALLAPRQLSALHSLAAVMGSSSRMAARNVLAKREMDRMRVRQKERSGTSRVKRANDSTSESEWSQTGPRSAAHNRTSTQQQQPPSTSTSSAAALSSPPLLVPSSESLSSVAVSSPLWSVRVALQHAVVAVLEDDDTIRAEWWLEPVTLPHSSPSPSMVLSPLISGLSVDHLLLSLRDARLEASLTAERLSTSVTVSELLVEEYLQQYRLLQSTLPSLAADGSLVYDRKQQRLGFSVRRLMWFERPSLSGQQPHVRCSIESAVDGALPRLEEETLTEAAAVSNRVKVDLLPVHVDLDLGLLSRLTALFATFSPPSIAELAIPSVLSSSLSSSLSIAPSESANLFMERTLSDRSSLSSPSSSLLVASRSAPAAASSVHVLLSSLDVSVLFPADTASQAAVPTPLLRDGPKDSFDSRGLVRGERVVLHVDRVACHSHPAAAQGGQHEYRYSDEDDIAWTVSFDHATVDLLYPKEEKQMRQPCTNTAAPVTPSCFNPLNFHVKRILATAHTTASPLSTSLLSRPHSVTLIKRGLLPPLPAHRLGDGAATHSADSVRHLEALFLNGLPTYRWFEQANDRANKPADAAASSPPTAAASSTSSSSVPSSAAAAALSTASPLSPSASASDAYLFEQLSAAHSSVVLDIELASCSVHLSKVELDLVLLLYTIYDEITTPAPPTALLPPLQSSESHSPSLRVRPMSASRGDAVVAHPVVTAASGGDAMCEPAASCPHESYSASDSDSEGSEMFESVVGAESVFFQRPGSDKAANGQLRRSQPDTQVEVKEGTGDGGDDDEHVASLSDLDSSVELDGDSADDEQLRAATVHNSQFGMQSLLMGRSQQLTDGVRRVTEAAAGSSGGSPTVTTSLYSSLLAAPIPAATTTSATISNSLLFHSFVDQPASLSSSAVLPPATSFVPVSEQPYKFVKPPVTHMFSTRSSASTRTPLASHRHRLAVRLSVREGGICLQEEPVPLPLFSPLSSSPVPPTSLSPPQSFLLDVQRLHLFQCSKLDGKDVSYVSVRAADCSLREYLRSVEADELSTAPSIPLLFKTLTDRSSSLRGSSASRSTTSTTGALWHDPVFVAQFIVALSPSLHLRETTAALNLRALTLAYRPQSEWLGKLTDFFTLTAPPYVQTVGRPLQLNQHYTDFAPQPRQLRDGPQPPPMTQDLVKLAFHVYDACFDYNPPDIAARAVLLVDHFHLHTTVHPLNKHSDVVVELRDAAVYLMPTSAKAQHSPAASSWRVVSPPQLHRLAANSTVSYLEELNCARVSVLDYLDARFIQQDVLDVDRSRPLLRIELTNGELEVLTCADSFATLVEVASHVTHALVQQRETKEVEITHFTRDQSNNAWQRSTQANHDEKYEERDDKEEKQPKHERPVADKQQRDGGEPSQPLDILQAVDPHLFGPDLGHTHRDSTSQQSIVDTYCDEVNKATSISLALQAAAERELEKARRERQLNASIMVLQLQEEHRNRQREAGGDGQSSSSIGEAYRQSATGQPPDDDDGLGEQRAHWFSRSEMDEREVRDAMEQHSRTMPERSEQLQQQQPPHDTGDDIEMRRRRDEELEEQLEIDRERKRRRLIDSGKQVSRKHQPMQPHIIDGHVTQPTEPHSGRGSREEKDGREEGAAQAAVRRYRLGDKTAGTVAHTELLLHNVSVRWKVFDGSDWLDDRHSNQQPPHNNATASSGHRSDVVEVEDGSEEHDELRNDRHVHEGRGPASEPLSAPRAGFSPSYAPQPDKIVPGGAAVHENYVPASVSTSRTRPHGPMDETTPAITTAAAATTARFSMIAASAGGAASLSTLPLMIPSIGRGVRRTDRMLELSLSGVHLLHQSFSTPLGNSDSSGSGAASVHEPSSSLSLAVQRVEVVDGIISSPYRLLLSSNTPVGHSAATRTVSAVSSCAVRLDALSVQPNDRPHEAREELRVEVTLHPLRVSVDQDAVELLIAFFSRPLVLHTASSAPSTESYVTDESFCQLFALTQPVRLTIDYHPRRVSYAALRAGDYAQLLHLFPLKKLRLELAATTLTGLSLSAVGSHLVTQWADDIARNQLHHYLSAIQPLRSIVNVGTGVVDLVVLPYSQYKKHGRVMRAVKRGVSSLAKHAAVEGLGLLLTVTHSANVLLREVDAIVAPAGSASGGSLTSAGGGVGSLSLAVRTPDSLRAGLSVAYARLSASVHDAAHSLVVVPRDEWTRRGGRLGVLSVVRNLPAAALQPMIGATDALHATIMAAQNSVDRTLVHERNLMLKRPAE